MERRWRARGIRGSLLAGLACTVWIACSSEEEYPVREIARQDVGPAGGTVTGGAVTIEIPEGALTETKTIVIGETDPRASALPAETQIAGGLYVLGPDDVTFLKEVTVTVHVDESKKRDDGKGALVLFRGAGKGAWTPYGADETTAKVVVGKTTHFSRWVPTAAAETYCYLNQCSPFPRTSVADPSVLPGLDCQVPATGGKGVACKSIGPDKGPPYECRCVGSTGAPLATWERLPPDTAVSALAYQCGAPACPKKPTFACDLGLVCEDSTNGGWTCSTARNPRVLCSGGPGGTSCSCTNSTAPFTLPGTNKLTNDELVGAWQQNCGGSCANAGTDPNADWVCPGSIVIETPGGGCKTETAGTCRDNKVYSAECVKGEAGSLMTCTCKVDGAATNVVYGNCVQAPFSCGFPRAQGEEVTDKICAAVEIKPLVDGPQPSGCRIGPGGTCLDGHTYSAECTLEPGQQGPCTCIIDGVPTQTFGNITCEEAPAKCGFPPSK